MTIGNSRTAPTEDLEVAADRSWGLVAPWFVEFPIVIAYSIVILSEVVSSINSTPYW